jgi:hypothetical protein
VNKYFCLVPHLARVNTTDSVFLCNTLSLVAMTCQTQADTLPCTGPSCDLPYGIKCKFLDISEKDLHQ